jgi:hypothetical protein
LIAPDGDELSVSPAAAVRTAARSLQLTGSIKHGSFQLAEKFGWRGGIGSAVSRSTA